MLLPLLPVPAAKAAEPTEEKPATKAVSVSSISVPAYSGGTSSSWMIYDGGLAMAVGDTSGQSKMRIVTGTTTAQYSTYLTTLKDAGYTKLFGRATPAQSGSNRHDKHLSPDGTFKGYRTDSLADANMTEEHKSYLSDIEAVTFGNTNQVLNDLENASIQWKGKALNLESKVCLKFIFSMGSYTGDLSDLSLHVTYTDTYGAEKNLILTDAELYNSKLSYYAFTLDALLAAELRTVVSIQVYAGETPVSCTLQYSADTYGNNKQGDLLELCKALFAYSDSAKAYFTNEFHRNSSERPQDDYFSSPNTTIQLKVDTFNWTLCAQLGT